MDKTSLGQVMNCIRCNKAFVIQADDDTTAPFAPSNGNDRPNSPPEDKKLDNVAVGWLLLLAGIAIFALRFFAKVNVSSVYRVLLGTVAAGACVEGIRLLRRGNKQ